MALPSDDDVRLDDALELLHFAYRTVTDQADQMLARRGLGRVHHRILYFVRRNPGLRVGDLLQVLAITKQSLHGPMQELLRGDYLTAERSEQNRRTKILVLTRSGAALERALSGLQRRLFAEAFAAVPARAPQAWRAVMFELGGRLATPREP